MSHFLYKPHISGPENQVTTPDILIDRVRLYQDDKNGFIPVQRLSSEVEIQVFDNSYDITPAYAFVACGGGVLFGLTALIRPSGDALEKSDLHLARSAWRLRNIIDHFDFLQLESSSGSISVSAKLDNQLHPSDIMNVFSEGELALPRGMMTLCAVNTATIKVSAPAGVNLALIDNVRERSLLSAVKLLSVNADSWAERPMPRYTVGPVGKVKHYI